MPPVLERDVTPMTLSPQDASILSAIAGDPTIRNEDPALYERLLGRLGSVFASEVAQALTGDEDVREEARQAAQTMLHWVEEKRHQARRTRERLQFTRRPLRRGAIPFRQARSRRASG
jgi:hypothetical protein